MKHLFSITALLVSIAALSLSLVLFNKEKKIYYVNNGAVYDGFTLKKEYEKQIQDIRVKRKNMMDSLEFSIRKLESEGKQQELAFEKQYYIEKAGRFEEDEEHLLSEYNEQIWKRLNQYAIEYSKANNIDILFGASGNGTLLFGKESINLTSEFTAYANKRYSGKS